MENNYFGDDIVARFKKFIEVVYGKETLYENLDFIAETLGKRSGENSEETIRRYFINDFYNDHVKMYLKEIGKVSLLDPAQETELAKKMAEEMGIKLGDFMMPIRMAVTGSRVSPPLMGSILILGVEKSIERIERTLATF